MASATVSRLANRYRIALPLAAAIVNVSQQLGIRDPEWLANVINFESNGFNPKARNPRSGATGLIQFTRTTAEELGTTVGQIAQMSALQQMGLVKRYFQMPRIRKYGPLRSQIDVAMAVFYPALIGSKLGDRVPAIVTEWNPNVHTVGQYIAPMLRRAPGSKGGHSPSPSVPGASTSPGARKSIRVGTILLVVGLASAAIAYKTSR